MVRVIPVHNFQSQTRGQIDEPTATCTVNFLGQDLLLLALTSHCIKVHSLSGTESKLLTIFPTVDMVKQLLHCDKGNYVATLEKKLSRDGTSNYFVRVYVNWEMSSNQNQAMRARIAGRVTPSFNRSLHSFEMIELPLNCQPTQIACCQTTGNLLVVMGNNAVIHKLKVETHQLSKHKFLDFEIRPWSLKFSFQPSHIEIAEEFISIMNSFNFMLFKLTNRLNDSTNLHGAMEKKDQINCQNKKRTNQNNINIPFRKELTDDERTNKFIDFTKSVSNESSHIDWDQLIFKEPDKCHKFESPNSRSENFFITLPLIRSKQLEVFHSLDSPIIPVPEMSATIITKSNMESCSENFSIKHLLRLKIPELAQHNGAEYFTCSILRSRYYRTESFSSKIKKSLLRSKKYNVFNGVTCLICTVQEGYLYHFSPQCSTEVSTTFKSCTIYPFTSPVSHVALENTALHALTEAGLESYTLKFPDNSSMNSDQKLGNRLNGKSNDELESVLLIGLRPFLGVRKLLHASKCLVLLASDHDIWTYNSLSLPNPEDVYNDILNAAYNHRESSPKTYKRLLGEAFSILKTGKDIFFYSSDAAYSSNIDTAFHQRLENLFKQSCALLGDFHILSESPTLWNLSVHYYKTAGLNAPQVLDRKYINRASGLVTYLSEILLNLQSGAEADALFQKHNVVSILGNAEAEDLIKLILASPVLREYATEKLISLLLTFEQTDSCLFALVLLYTQADKQNQAEKILVPISNSFINEITLTYWSWLFDGTNSNNENIIPTFSEYAEILMKKKVEIFAKILGKLVEQHVVTLHQVIQIFLEYLPTRVGRDGRCAGMALQLFLETYLQQFYEDCDSEIQRKSSNHNKNQIHNDNLAVCEGFKFLIRSYLVELAQASSNFKESIENEGTILFENSRPSLYNCPELYGEKKKYKNEGEKVIIQPKILKLQALLASGHVPNECYQEVDQFLQSQNVEGSFSFKILCEKDTEKGIQLLTNNCPQVLLHYAKVRSLLQVFT